MPLKPSTSGTFRRRLRQLALFILNPNPRGLARADVWGIGGVLILILAGQFTRVTTSTLGIPTYTLNDNGQWAPFVAGSSDYRRSVLIQFELELATGLGWSECNVPSIGFRAVGPGTLASNGMTQADLDAAARQAVQDAIDNAMSRAGRSSFILPASISPGYSRTAGILYWPRKALLPTAVLLLAAATGVGALRRIVRAGYMDRLTQLQAGKCPRCSYPLAGLRSKKRCPECGLDISKDIADSLRDFGE